MPRYTSTICPKELKTAILTALNKKHKTDLTEIDPALLSDLNAPVKKDLSKIDCDFSQASIKEKDLPNLVGLHMMEIDDTMAKARPDDPRFKDNKGALAFCGAITKPKDGETPVFFIIYQNYDGTLRAYLPRQGNGWDPKTKKPKQSQNDNEPLTNIFNQEKILSELRKRIEYFGQEMQTLSFIPDIDISDKNGGTNTSKTKRNKSL